MEKNNFEEINFQHYVDAVKQKRIDWNIFIDFIQDLSYSDRDRLRILNAIGNHLIFFMPKTVSRGRTVDSHNHTFIVINS